MGSALNVKGIVLWAQGSVLDPKTLSPNMDGRMALNEIDGIWNFGRNSIHMVVEICVFDAMCNESCLGFSTREIPKQVNESARETEDPSLSPRTIHWDGSLDHAK